MLEKVPRDGYAQLPFESTYEDKAKALVCESTSDISVKISNSLKNMNYSVAESSTYSEAIRNLRYNEYQLVLINDKYDAENSGAKHIFDYLNQLSMSIRRNIFVVLLSGTLRTMDKMAAFNRSVNIVINSKNIDDAGEIISRGIDDNEAFYRILKEYLKKKGRA